MAQTELSVVLTVGGGVGAYPVRNPYGGDLAELLIHAVTGVGATTLAILDLYSTLTTAASNPTITSPLRGLIFTGSGAGSSGNNYAPIATQAEDSAVFNVVTGTAVYLVYQWRRIVPDPGANAINTTLEATKALVGIASAACDQPPGKCNCKSHQALERYLGDSRLGERV